MHCWSLTDETIWVCVVWLGWLCQDARSIFQRAYDHLKKQELKEEDAEDDLGASQSILQKLASKDLVGLPQPWSFDPVEGITYNGSNELPEAHREAAATALAHKVMQAAPHGRIPQTPWDSRAAAHAAAAEVEASGAEEEATDDGRKRRHPRNHLAGSSPPAFRRDLVLACSSCCVGLRLVAC